MVVEISAGFARWQVAKRQKTSRIDNPARKMLHEFIGMGPAGRI
jgi:hypothetical protein